MNNIQYINDFVMFYCISNFSATLILCINYCINAVAYSELRI